MKNLIRFTYDVLEGYGVIALVEFVIVGVGLWLPILLVSVMFG